MKYTLLPAVLAALPAPPADAGTAIPATTPGAKEMVPRIAFLEPEAPLPPAPPGLMSACVGWSVRMKVS